jgi:hypothetical protein
LGAVSGNETFISVSSEKGFGLFWCNSASSEVSGRRRLALIHAFRADFPMSKFSCPDLPASRLIPEQLLRERQQIPRKKN